MEVDGTGLDLIGLDWSELQWNWNGLERNGLIWTLQDLTRSNDLD